MILKSKKNKNIEYIENTNLDDCDRECNSQLYEYDIFGITVIISIGKRNDEFVNEGIIYFPVYLISNNKFVSRIGVIEVNENCENNIYDEDGDVDLDNCSEPLFFNFVSYEYLSKKYSQNNKNEESETEICSANITEEIFESDDIWINTFLSSNEYSIFDNDGDGDCLFVSLKYAYSGININMSVSELRNVLSENVTEEVYLNYKNLYDSFKQSIIENIEEMECLKIKNDELKSKIQNMRNRSERKSILFEGEENTKKFNSLKNQNKLSNVLLGEYEFMSSVTNIDDLKSIVQKKSFWADTWAISTLEKELGIKIVILSSENFENGDIDNILLCGQKTENNNNKNPEYYIILDYNGCHYKLITYNGLTIFNFEYLPSEIKELICNKCLENMGGDYNYIPDFANLINKNVKNRDTKDDDNELYDVKENTVFMIHSKSANHSPGKGTGENIVNKNRTKYTELENIKNWRRILSTHYESPFKLDGLEWNTVEHYLQGVKFKNSDPEYYKSFSLNSESKYNKDPVLVKKEIVKKIKLCDETYNYTKSLYDAYFERIKNDDFSRNVLLLTKKAKIIHYLYKKPPVPMRELMLIRKEITNNKI